MSDSTVIEWAWEVEEGIQRLTALLRIEQKKQRAVGRDIVIGLSATLLTLLLPPILAHFQTVIAAIVGGSSVAQGINWLRRDASSLNALETDPMWCIWRAISKT